MSTSSTMIDDLKSRISKLLYNESLCDVTFLVDNPPHRYSSHKLILATGSEVFEAMLYGKMAERGEIRIPDVTARGFHTMLRFLYTDTTSFENELEVLETAYCAKKYLIDSLFRDCENYLLSLVLNTKTVLIFYEKAALLEMKKLKKKCLRYVSRHASKILSSPRMLEVSMTTFRDILKLDFMDIESEKRIIESVWKWGEERCQEKGLDKSSKNVRKSIEGLLNHLRFLSLSLEELEEVFRQFDLVDDVDQLTILWNIAMHTSKESDQMPSNLCREFKNRSISSASRLTLPTEYRYNGDMTSVSSKKFKQHIDLSVEGSGIIIFGIAVAFKPIPCYSSSHRQLRVDITLRNETTNNHSKARLFQKAQTKECENQIEEVMLDEFIHLGEGDTGSLEIETTLEGVRLMECIDSEFSLVLNSTVITCSVKIEDQNSFTIPIKEFICAPD